MSLSKDEIGSLMRLVGLTKDDEINCERCLALVAERGLAGRSIPVGLEAVEHHLSLCAECREEYDALLRVLKAIDP